MPRYKLTIEYDGTPFVGWQRQGIGRSVQAALEEAIARFCREEIRVNGAGRTDTGVHALGQVAHIDLARAFPSDTVRDAINAHLKPEPVAVIAAEVVPDAFDARFSATGRHYRYVLRNRRAPLTLERDRAWLVQAPLDVAAMAEGARHLLGTHDFTTFRAAECQAKSPVKTLDRLEVAGEGDRVTVEASARSFLHRQVRSMVGSLVQVGIGRWRPHDMKAALEAADRTACGQVAPAAGLYLVAVDYPPRMEPDPGPTRPQGDPSARSA